MPDVAVLETLGTFNLQLNEMSGPLPAAWGSPGALPSLTSLVINNNQFTGGQWGARRAGRRAGCCILDSCAAACCNALHRPPAVGCRAKLCMLRAAGSLPEAWGRPGALPRLSLLALGINRLNGTLPADMELPSLLIL